MINGKREMKRALADNSKESLGGSVGFWFGSKLICQDSRVKASWF